MPARVGAPVRMDLVALAAASLAALLFAHWAALAAMAGLWSRSPMYSYAVTVPFISAYLLWSQRARFAALAPHGSWLLGGPVLAFGIVLLLVGRIGGIQILAQLAFLVSLVGTIVVVAGWRYVSVGWAGLAYLLLMIPLWDGLTESLHVPFQNQSAATGITLMRLIGIPAYRDGIYIALPNLNIEVARACSGVNYLVAVIALGLPLAYLYLRSNVRRVALIASAVVIAALSNGLRVALIGTLAYYEVGSPLHGPGHVLHGLFVAGIGYVVLFLGLHYLSETPAEGSPSGHQPAVMSTRRMPLARLGAVAALFVAIGAAPTAREVSPVPLKADLGRVPMALGTWISLGSTPVDVPEWKAWASADRALKRRYTSPQGTAVDVYIGYFASQSQTRELASAGAADLHRAAKTLLVPTAGGQSFTANVVPPSGSRAQTSLFWYELDGAVEVSRPRTVMRTAWNGVAKGRSNGVVIMLSTPESTPREEVLVALTDVAGRMRQAVQDLLADARPQS